MLNGTGIETEMKNIPNRRHGIVISFRLPTLGNVHCLVQYVLYELELMICSVRFFVKKDSTLSTAYNEWSLDITERLQRCESTAEQKAVIDKMVRQNRRNTKGEPITIRGHLFDELKKDYYLNSIDKK